MPTIMDPVPLLPTDAVGRRHQHRHLRLGLRSAAQFLRRATSRRMVREPSLLAREAAAAEVMEQGAGTWAHSRPVVLLDVLWNLSFVSVAAVVLMLSLDESPAMPMRLWVLGYGLQCLFHIVTVCVGVRERRRIVDENGRDDDEEKLSIAKSLESAYTMFSLIWWVIGFYWITTGGKAMSHDAPQLYWLSVVFLAFDVLFLVFCVGIACIIGVCVCCCLPCIIAILYAVADQEGASEEDIRKLPKFKFRRIEDPENGEITGPSGGIMTELGSDAPIEHALSAENANCCICITSYDDGMELRELPCSHHFHSHCIEKWLIINATCPLCKFNILKTNNNNNGIEEV